MKMHGPKNKKKRRSSGLLRRAAKCLLRRFGVTFSLSPYWRSLNVVQVDSICPILQDWLELKTKVLRSFETSVAVYQYARRKIPKHLELQQHCCANFETYNFFLSLHLTRSLHDICGFIFWRRQASSFSAYFSIRHSLVHPAIRRHVTYVDNNHHHHVREGLGAFPVP